MSTILAPEITISKEAKKALLQEEETEGQVILHVDCVGINLFSGIRIWPTTFLFPNEGGESSKLITAENIGIYPNWLILATPYHRFTLIFSALPKSCRVFEMKEIIPQPNGFYFGPILRNDTDVYVLEMPV